MNVADLVANKASSVLGAQITGELLREMGARSKQIYQHLLPPIDMFEEGNEIVVIIDLPGFSKNDINLRISDNVLSISATRGNENNPTTFYYSQRPNQIHKKVVLPISVDEDEKVVGTAKFVDGVVTLRIPIPKSSNITIV